MMPARFEDALVHMAVTGKWEVFYDCDLAANEGRPIKHTMSAWYKDFKFTRAGIYVRATDMVVPITVDNTKSTLIWFVYYLAEIGRSVLIRIGKPKAKIYAVPARPRAWYLLWSAAYHAGYKFVKTPDVADIQMSFQDKTTLTGHLPAGSINGDCVDISKSHVEHVFEQVFGYPLAVDPLTHTGKMVVKSEINGVHDGKIIQGPVTPQPGKVYQRLINTRTTTPKGDFVTDLRCPSAGGHIDLIYIKRRPADKRFANMNSDCRLAKPEDHLSDAERETLSRFAAAMRLDWGGMDVLRDNDSGLIYVVDVNKTDMGPIVLPLKDKLRAVSILAKSLTKMIDAKLKDAP